MKKNLRALSVALAGLLAGMVASAADPTYSVTRLPADFERATAINNLGDIVGYTSAPQAILLRSGQTTVQQIPSLVGLGARAYGVNDNLQIVGESVSSDRNVHAFLYSGGLTRDLGTLDGHQRSGATAINAKGLVVGWSQADTVLEKTGNFLTLPFFYSRGRMTAIEAIGGLSAWATAISDFGDVVGNAELIECDGVPPIVIRPFRYSPSASGMIGMGGLGGNNGQAMAINANGLIVGSEEPILDNRTAHAVAWFNGVISRPTDLGTIGARKNSVAKGVNKAGQIVGYAYDDNDPPASRRAFLYLNGAMYDLNDRLDSLSKASWLIREAIAINDGGQIVAEGCTQNTTDCGHALLLSPVTASKPRRR